MDPLGQAAGQAHEQQVGGLHGEAALEVHGVEAGAGPQYVLAAAQQRADLLPEFRGARGGDQPLAGPDEERVSDGAAEPGQGAADGRG